MPASFRLSDAPSMDDTLLDTYQNGWTFDAMVAAATQNVDNYRITRSRAVAAPEYATRVEATGRDWHLLSVTEDWCGDSLNTLPWVDALAESSPRLSHRLIRRDEHLPLMDAHLTNGRTRSIPIVILLDDQFVERAWWGPRPAEMQAWFESAEAQAMTRTSATRCSGRATRGTAGRRSWASSSR
jgi:hypothetical protein